MTLDEIKRYHQYAKQLQAQQQPERGLDAVQPLKPEFGQAKAATEPLQTSEIPQRAKTESFATELTGQHFSQTEPVTQKFNAAHNDNQPEKFEGQNSKMVEGQQQQHLNHPPAEMRREPDREKYTKELQAERDRSAELEAIREKARMIQERQEAASPRQSRGMRM